MPATGEHTPGTGVDPLDFAALSVDQLAAAAVGLRARMQTKIREAAQQLRAGRPEQPAEEDVFPLVRQLGLAAETLDAIGKAFTEAAKTARQETLEDVVAVRRTDAPRGLLRVPDAGGDLLVTPEWGTAATVDVNEVAAVLADVAWRDLEREHLPASLSAALAGAGIRTVGLLLVPCPLTGEVLSVRADQERVVQAGAYAGALAAIGQLRAAGKWEPQTTKLKKIREALSRRGLDQLAGRLRAAETRTDVWKDAVTVKREAAKR